jgi:hypothetical protein
MPCCLFYCHLASQLDPKPFKRVIVFWFSSTKKEGSCILWGASTDTSVDTSIEISVDVSIDTRPILGRYMVDMSTECRSSIDRDSVDNKPLYRPTYRPICLYTHVGRYS